MALTDCGLNVWRSDSAPAFGELGALWSRAGTEFLVGHPTYHNADTIGRLLADGIRGAAMNFPGRKTAFVVSDGTFNSTSADRSVMDAAVSASFQALSTLARSLRESVCVVVCPYEGYGGDSTPGKGSALKMIFDEMGRSSVRTLMLADGDLRNDMSRWQQVYAEVDEEHRRNHPGKPMFITARYARHFVDASLTRFIVGPLTTLAGCYVPGGISGDIVLSSEAVALERNAEWTEARRKYGTDISTTLDNIAHGETVIYEVYLGAKLHDITDEAKLSVMPGEVIGAALERLLQWENAGGIVSATLRPECALRTVVEWGPERTGIEFIDPGETSVFDIDTKLDTLITRFSEYDEALSSVLAPEAYQRVAAGLEGAAGERAGDAPVASLGIDSAFWVELLQQGVAFALATGELDRPKKCLNYLYTAAFLEFVKERLVDLGLDTFGKVRAAQCALAVPPDAARQFYTDRVDGVARRLALDFFARRSRLAERYGEL